MLCREVTRQTDDDSACYRRRGRRGAGGPTYTRIASTVRASKRPRVVNHGKHITAIGQHLHVMLAGPARASLHRAQIARFNREVHKAVKAASSSGGGRAAPYADVMPRVVAIRRRFGYFLNAPMKELNRALVRRIAEALYAYLQRIEPFMDVDIGGKMLSTFTAFMAQNMATGYRIGDVEVVPRFAMFHRHAPSPSQYSELPGISCNKISLIKRMFKLACVSGGGGTVRRPMILARSGMPLPA